MVALMVFSTLSSICQIWAHFQMKYSTQSTDSPRGDN